VELVYSLSKGRLYGCCNRKKYVWLDVFTVHQHEGKFKTMDLQAIPKCIETIRFTVVILDNGISNNWVSLLRKRTRPVAFSRIWCLDEIWSTLKYSGEVRLVPTSTSFGGVGMCGWFKSRRPFVVNCLDAEATVPYDLSRILAKMENAKAVCLSKGCKDKENLLEAVPFEYFQSDD